MKPENSRFRPRTTDDHLPEIDRSFVEYELELIEMGKTLDDTITQEQAKRLREASKR